MILVFGGAYQGKLEYAEKEFNINTVCDCSGGRYPDFSAEAVAGIEGFVMECVKDGIEAADYFREQEEDWKDSVLIITDISQGVVPVDSRARAAREMNGRLMLYLAAKADQVYRVFCGIGKRIR